MSPLSAKTSGKVSANGIEIYYQKTGSGPHLILIEGLGVATWLWEKQTPDFASHFTTIVYDNRGVGESDKPQGPYSVAMMADDLAGLMDALEIARAHILGVSMGGFIAQDFALRYPDRVDRLVLVSTSVGGAEHVAPPSETLAVFFATDSDPRRLIAKRLTLAYSQEYLGNDERLNHLVDLRMLNPQPPHAYMAQIAAGTTFDLANQAAAIKAPTLILAAEEDVLVPIENARRLHDKIESSELIVYPALGHQFLVEVPEQFNRDVIRFLSSNMTESIR